MTGKVWTSQEVAELYALVTSGNGVDEIAIQLKKSPLAIIRKCQRLGIKLEYDGYIDSAIPLPKELPSVEETAIILAGAMKAVSKPGLSKLEIQRLQVAANISKMYKEIIVDYAHYREVEKKLDIMIEENAKLQQVLKEIQVRSQNFSSQPVPG